MSKVKKYFVYNINIIFAIIVALASQAAMASPIQLFSGTLSYDDEIVWTDFNLAQSTSFTARSFSFGTGGFAPVLSLFALGGTQDLLQAVVGSNNTCATPGAGSASGGLCWDAFFSTVLAAGAYRLVISQDENLPNGLSFGDGFSQTGNQHYTGVNYLNDPSRSFVNFDGTQRTGDYLVTLEVGSQVPEPGPVGLMAIGLVAVAMVLRRNKKSSFSRII